MSKMGRYVLDQEEKGNIVMTETGYQPTQRYLNGDRKEPLIEDLVTPTTKEVSVTTDYTFFYKVHVDFDVNEDDQLTSLMANGTPINEGVSGSSQVVKDLSTNDSRTFTFEG
jgi:hypothetical protein